MCPPPTVACRRGLLLANLRRYFAEFLQCSSLKRLGMLYQSTCVGLGYDLTEGYFQEPLSGPPNPIRADNRRDPSLPPGPGILTWFPSTTPFGLALGADSPWEDYLYPGNLRLSADRFFTCLFVTHTGILPSATSRASRDCPFIGIRNAPLPLSGR